MDLLSTCTTQKKEEEDGKTNSLLRQLLYLVNLFPRVHLPKGYIMNEAQYAKHNADAVAKPAFQKKVDANPDPLWLRLLNAMARPDGITRSGIREVVGHKIPASKIEDALEFFDFLGVATFNKEKPADNGCRWSGGRSAERWHLRKEFMGLQNPARDLPSAAIFPKSRAAVRACAK
jgi:hypothetical protein